MHNAREAAWARARPLTEVIVRLDAARAASWSPCRSLNSQELAADAYREDVANTCKEFDAHLEELIALSEDD